MAAFKATPELPWDITEGGVIKLKDTTVTLQQLLNGRVTFDVVNSGGTTVTGKVEQDLYTHKCFILAAGLLLWQIGDISQETDTLVISPSQSVHSGFTLAGVHVNNLPVEFGYYLDGYTAFLAVKMIDGSVRVIECDGECFTGSEQDEGSNLYGAFAYYPSPISGGDAIAFRDAVNKSQAPIETISSSIIAENNKWFVAVAGVRFELELIPGDVSPLRVNSRIE